MIMTNASINCTYPKHTVSYTVKIVRKYLKKIFKTAEIGDSTMTLAKHKCVDS